jgi:flavodoxin
MKTLVVYDSLYGNTERIAQAIAGSIVPTDGVELLRVGEANPAALAAADLLIVGAPTHGGRPSPTMQTFLSKIPANALNRVGVTAFDTRVSAAGKGIGLRILIGILGYAARRIAASLQRKGGKLAAPPEGFIVEGKEGPLKSGELERAAAWAKGVQHANNKLPSVAR